MGALVVLVKLLYFFINGSILIEKNFLIFYNFFKLLIIFFTFFSFSWKPFDNIGPLKSQIFEKI